MPNDKESKEPTRVLLIEDSATVRNFLRKCLEAEFKAVEILEAEDGKAGFHLLGRNLVQLIITDLNMPGMDGMTFLEKLRGNAVLRKKPVLVLSGMLGDDVRQFAAGDPLLYLLPKPAGIPQISGALRELMTRAGRPLAGQA